MDVSGVLQTDLRRKALDDFATLAGLPRIAQLLQGGRDTDSAQYTIVFEDGRHVRIGTIKVLWSQAEMSKVLSVALSKPLPPIKAATWDTLRSRLIEHGVEVDERQGETFADTVRDWLGSYCESAGTDRDGAARARKPFIENDDVHVHAVGLARDIRRQYSASVKEKDLLGALNDLGFERRTIMYNRGSQRTSASYYVAPLDVLDPGDVL